MEKNLFVFCFRFFIFSLRHAFNYQLDYLYGGNDRERAENDGEPLRSVQPLKRENIVSERQTRQADGERRAHKERYKHHFVFEEVLIEYRARQASRVEAVEKLRQAQRDK